MPSCSIKNCKNRTCDGDAKGITFFRFPKEIPIRKQWLNACQQTETSLKVDSARICSDHFDTNCFIMEFTKPRSKNTLAKEVRRLKKGSVPCNMLKLCAGIKRKRMSQNEKDNENNKKIKGNNVLIKTGIPTYAELVQYAKEKQELDINKEISNNSSTKTLLIELRNSEIDKQQLFEENQNQNIEKDNINVEEETQNMTREYLENIEQNDTIELDINEEINMDNNASSMETLVMQLRNSEEEKQQLFEEKQQLLEENQDLEQKNEQLNKQISQLQAEVTKIMKNKQKEAEAIATNALSKVFTPGQISILMSTQNRVHWSHEDIMSAISLRSLSPKAYKYLRNVKKVPLPCLTTLHNWVAKFTVLPGILNEVLNIMSSKGHNLSTVEKITVLNIRRCIYFK
ncbi:uncharacterized protein LOC143905279 [Temnothorax americanus]|uniref:uncharacterized protein LOC143905279 n=1 Tax=Temnothorax americanus TaxID=1964332 RepID=UPI004068AF3E